jgi:hypothetical protein
MTARRVAIVEVRMVVADMDMAAFGDVDMDMAASSRTSSSRASSGRSSFAFLRTGSIPSGGSSLSFLRAHHMSVDDRDSTPSDHMRLGDVNDSMVALSLALSAQHAVKQRRFLRSASV